jgi:glycosyltransferase involved in cell wall biosynthesis
MHNICIVVQNVYDFDVRVRRKAEALVAAGYSVDVLALAPANGKTKYVLDGVNVYAVSLGKKRGSPARYIYEYTMFFVWTFFRVLGLMRRRHFVLIDVNTLPDFLIFAVLPARWMGAKLLLDMHEITPEFYASKYGMAPDSWIVRFLQFQERISFDCADHVLTINAPIQDLIVNRGLPPTKSTVIMNAADEARFASKILSPAGEGSPDVFAMMYHGTLTSIYGLDIAIEAFHIALKDMPGAELWILGPGPERGALAELAQRYGLTSKVKLVGQVPPDEIPAWLNKCTVGVLPIRRDVFLDFAFPNKLPEFIITGKPVLMSRLKAIRHYFSEDALAYFEPNNPEDLAGQMIRLYRDQELRARLAVRAKEEYLPIRWDVMKERYLRTIERTIGPGKQAPEGPCVPDEAIRQDEPHAEPSARLSL